MNLSKTGKYLLISWLVVLVIGGVLLAYSEPVSSVMLGMLWIASGFNGTVLGSIVASCFTT